MGKDFSMNNKETKKNCNLSGELGIAKAFEYVDEHPDLIKILTSIEEDVEERNDVYIYKTLRYPPKSTPPTAN